MLLCVRKTNGDIHGLPAAEAHELVKKGQAIYVPRFVLKAAEVGIDEATARKTPWPELQKMIAQRKAPKKHQKGGKAAETEDSDPPGADKDFAFRMAVRRAASEGAFFVVAPEGYSRPDPEEFPNGDRYEQTHFEDV